MWSSQIKYDALYRATVQNSLNSGDTIILSTWSKRYISVEEEYKVGTTSEIDSTCHIVIEKKFGDGPIHSYDEVVLFSLYNGRHLDVEDDIVRARFYDKRGSFQKLYIEKLNVSGKEGQIFSGDTINLFSDHTKKHIDVENNEVKARFQDARGKWQKLEIEKIPKYEGAILLIGDSIIDNSIYADMKGTGAFVKQLFRNSIVMDNAVGGTRSNEFLKDLVQPCKKENQVCIRKVKGTTPQRLLQFYSTGLTCAQDSNSETYGHDWPPKYVTGTCKLKTQQDQPWYPEMYPEKERLLFHKYDSAQNFPNIDFADIVVSIGGNDVMMSNPTPQDMLRFVTGYLGSKIGSRVLNVLNKYQEIYPKARIYWIKPYRIDMNMTPFVDFLSQQLPSNVSIPYVLRTLNNAVDHAAARIARSFQVISPEWQEGDIRCDLHHLPHPNSAGAKKLANAIADAIIVSR